MQVDRHGPLFSPYPTKRPVIAFSWHRAQLSGLDPEAPADNPVIEEFDPKSRLLAAAAPVLDRLADQLLHTGFSLMLADGRGRIVDIRCGRPQLRPRLESIGAVHGSRFVEETTGTNSIATALELRQGVAVHGDEHFVESFKKFACFGRPIVHPVTRRAEGVLDITCLREDDSPLLPPLIDGAVRDIEEQLLAGAREADRRMLAEYHRHASTPRSAPVVALGDDLLLANAKAVELLQGPDYALLRSLVADASTGGSFTRHLELSTGASVRAAVDAMPGGGRALITLHPEKRPRRVEVTTAVASRVLIHGEPGTGRTQSLTDLVGTASRTWLDACEIPEVGDRDWLRRATTALRGNGLVAIEAIDLLPAAVARRLVEMISTSPARVVLTSRPVNLLSGDAAALAAQCPARIELAPLRHRRDEMPALVHGMLSRIGARRDLRFTPGALEALASRHWPGNLRELRVVVEHVATHRVSGDVLVQDLPEAYRGRVRVRSLSPIEQAEHDAIVEALRACDGEKKAAAQRLGISRTTLYKAIRTFGIVPAPADRVSI